MVEATKTGVTATRRLGPDRQSADQRPPRRLVCAAHSRRDQDGDVRTVSRSAASPAGNAFLTDGNDTTEQFLQRECRTHAHQLADFAGRRAGIPGGIQRLSRPSSDTPWAAWSTPSPAAATNDVHGTGVLVLPQPGLQCQRHVSPPSTRSNGVNQPAPASAERSRKTSFSTSSEFRLTRRDFPCATYRSRQSVLRFRRQLQSATLRRPRPAHRRAVHTAVTSSNRQLQTLVPYRHSGTGIRQTRLAPHGTQYLQRQLEPAALGFAQRHADPGCAE